MEYIKKNIILVPVDFTEIDDFAISHAIGIAKSLNYSICLLHVKETINLLQIKGTKLQLRKGKLVPGGINKKLVKMVTNIQQKHNVKTNYVFREGNVFRILDDTMRDVGANLIVIGTHGKRGTQKIVGSSAFKAISASLVPVIIVQKHSFENGYKNIIVPLDDTTESKQKIKWALYIAKKFHSNIHIFAMKETDDILKRKTLANIKQIKTIFTQNEIICTSKIAEHVNGFAKQLINYSGFIHADMIMIMTNPDKLIPSFILTSIDEKMIYNKLQIPVFCINPIELNVRIAGF